MILLKPAATAAVGGVLATMSSYITYSVQTKKHIERNIIPPMEVLAAYQQPSSGLGGTHFITNELVLGVVDSGVVDSVGVHDDDSSSSIKAKPPIVSSKFPIDLLLLLKDDNSTPSDTSDWIWIAGDEDLTIPTAKKGDVKNQGETPIFRSTPSGDFACLISPDGQSSALFGRLSRTISTTNIASSSRRRRKTLRELVQQKTKYLTIDSNMFDRADWNYIINQCQDVLSMNGDDDGSSSISRSLDIDESYRFCYRDYVNHEEMFGMLCQRWTIIRFLFRPALAEELVISTPTTTTTNDDDDDDDHNNSSSNSERLCSLNGNGLIFGCIPIHTRWDGRIVEPSVSKTDDYNISSSSSSDLAVSIEWDRTKMRMGWKRFGTTIDRPAVAEKLRVDPWRIKLPSDDDDDDDSDNNASGDILCFLREGKGHLIFARDHCLSERPSLRKRVRRRLSRLFRRRSERSEDKEQGSATAVA
mmetsp:Transcript_32014/g.77905  ORF Transcript_32014/g.77905 Transcript_32014/m.77905 type:complete len:473 (+) Transcript_32014:3054-4472(+)